MAKVLISHKVKDYHTWRPFFDRDAERRRKFGISNEHVYRDAKDENHIFVSGYIDDPSVLDAFFRDPELAEKMAEGGVISEPVVQILNPA